MNIKSSIGGIQHTCINFFNFPYNYKNRVLACFQTRPQHFTTIFVLFNNNFQQLLIRRPPLIQSSLVQLFGSVEGDLNKTMPGAMPRSGSSVDLNGHLSGSSGAAGTPSDKTKHRFSLPSPSERPYGLCELPL